MRRENSVDEKKKGESPLRRESSPPRLFCTNKIQFSEQTVNTLNNSVPVPVIEVVDDFSLNLLFHIDSVNFESEMNNVSPVEVNEESEIDNGSPADKPTDINSSNDDSYNSYSSDSDEMTAITVIRAEFVQGSINDNTVPSFCCIREGLSIYYTNADNLLGKIDELSVRVQADMPDIMVITEVDPKTVNSTEISP